MKTLTDAVNEFKGEWPCDMLKVECPGFTCTADQFADKVYIMMLNYGDYSELEFSHYASSSKLLLTKDLDKEIDMGIDWSKAPEGATHCLERLGVKEFGRLVNGEYQEIDDEGVIFIVGGAPDDYKVVSERPMFINCTSNNDPQPTPTFTQEMADNGVLPSEGMECLVRKTKDHKYIACKRYCTTDGIHFVKILDTDFIGDVVKAIGLPSRDFAFVCLDGAAEFKPLTTPITLIDGKAYQFEYNGLVWNGLYIKGGNSMLYSLGNPNVKLCTNIQPLTVEVK